MTDSKTEDAPDQVADKWVDQYADAMFRYALKKTGDKGAAEDLVQESFLAAISGRKGFRGESTLSTWLFAILKRKIVDHYRKQVREIGQEIGSSPVGENCESSQDWDSDPATICEDREFWATFEDCVGKLPNKLSEVYILREVNQHSPREIREMLQISATNLSMRLHRCRIAIRDCLNQNWFRYD